MLTLYCSTSAGSDNGGYVNKGAITLQMDFRISETRSMTL